MQEVIIYADHTATLTIDIILNTIEEVEQRDIELCFPVSGDKAKA